jgi:hypothetical protein
MEEKLITIETAELAKSKGFNIPVDGRYYWDPEYLKVLLSKQGIGKCNNTEESISAPTQSLLQKWLREELGINVFIVPALKEGHYEWLIMDDNETTFECDEAFTIYEDALEEGLKKAINLKK